MGKIHAKRGFGSSGYANENDVCIKCPSWVFSVFIFHCKFNSFYFPEILFIQTVNNVGIFLGCIPVFSASAGNNGLRISMVIRFFS
jgi:hypothetical protein